MTRLSRPQRRFTRRQQIAAVAAAALLGATALTLAGRGNPAASTPATTSSVPAASLTVGVTTPQTTTLARTLAASGSIAAKDELVIGSDATGVRLMEVRVDVGSVVRRGQLLARGDDAQLQAQHEQQEAQVRQARAELAQAESNLERAERVRDSGVYSVEAVQTRRTAAEAASARLQLAQAQRRELEVRIAHTRVLAPADGVIAKRSATVGAVVQPGLELFRLIRDEQLEWLAELPAHSLAHVQPGAPVRVALDDGRSVEGTVRLVEPTIDPHNRNGVVRVTLPRGTPLKAGGHANGEITTAQSAMLTLPESVVFTRDGQAYVYVVHVLGDGGVAQLTRIGTGMHQRGLVEVTGGVKPGMPVVATGAGFVKDGERVRISNEAAQATQGAQPNPGETS